MTERIEDTTIRRNAQHLIAALKCRVIRQYDTPTEEDDE